MGASVQPTSSAYERYKALRREGVSPEDASGRVASEFPNLEDKSPEGTVTAGPVASVGTPDTERERIAPPTVFNSGTLRPTPRPRLIGPVAPDVTAVKPAMSPLRPREMTVRAAPEPDEPTIGAAPRRETADYAIPEATRLDKLRQWRERNMERTLAAFDPKKIGTPEGQDAMMGIVMNLGEGPKIVGSAAKAAGKGARVTAEEMLEIGKRRAAELESGLPPRTAPDLTPAMEREGKMFADSPAPPEVIASPPTLRAFPDPKPARAAGTPVENVPTMADQRPRMFKEKDFELSPEGRAEFDAIMGPVGVQSRVTWKEAEELAKTIGTDPQKILRNVRDLSGEEILALKQGVSQNIARIETLTKIVQDPATPRPEQLAALGEIDRRMTDVSTMASRVTRETSQTGRDLNLMKVMGLNTMDPAVWTIQATKMKGLPLTPEETLAITRAAGERDREELARLISNLKQLTPWEKIVTTWKAGLLTNPKTHLVNIAGNSVMALMEQAKDAPAVAVDMMLSLASGTRTKAIPSLSSVASSVRQIKNQGLDAAKTVLRTGMTPADLQKWDFRNGRFGQTMGSERLGRWLDLYTNSVFRTLSAEDQLFKAAAVGRSLDEQIRVEAGNIFRAQKKKLGPKQTYAEIAKQLRANVPDAMQAQAMADADFATFNSDNILATAVQSGKAALKNVGGDAAAAVAESQMPFVRTPTNVLARTLDYTPAGILRAFRPAIKMVQGHDLDANQKRVAEAFGRAGTGSLMLWLGFEAMRNGIASGAMPRGAKDEWDVRGKIAGAVKVGDDWHQIVRMQPGGTLFALGAQLASIYENAESASDVIGGTAAAAGKIVTDQPFLQGVTRVTEALQEPERFGGTWTRSMAASAVPAVVGAVARGTDPYQRETQTVASAVKARVPGLSRSVPAKLDVFGRPLPQNGGVARQMFDVTNTSKDRETPVLKEARRLGVSLSRPSKTITVAGKAYTLSPDEYRAVQMQVGPEVLRRLEAAIGLPGYLKERKTPERTDLAQRERLEKAIREAKKKSSEELSDQIYAAEKKKVPHVGTLRPRRPKF